MVDQRSQFENAQQLYKSKKFRHALLEFEDYCMLHPKSDKGHFYIGLIHHELGNLAKAIDSFKKVLKLNPDHTEASISLSVIYNDIGNYSEAGRIFQETSNKVKKNQQDLDGIQDPHINQKIATKHYQLSKLYEQYNRFHEALFEIEKAIKLDQKLLIYQIAKAKLYIQLNLHGKAKELFMQLKSDHPTNVDIKIAFGELCYSQGHIVEAINEWNCALELNPKNTQARTYLDLSRNANTLSLN